jgi:uridine monophosphate synthetase
LTTEELLEFADKVGSNIVALKTHIDIITDFDYEKTIVPLLDLAKKHQFLLMEDRKFADIGNTQELQYSYGIYKTSSWADLVTSHVIGGYSSMDYFLNSGVVAILSMSSKGTLTDEHYRNEAEKIAVEHPNIIGGVSQISISENLLLFTPGINLATEGDGKGQQYRTPELAFKNLHTDFIIVGRGIYKAEDVEKASLEYKIEGWNAYEASL